MQQRLLVLQSKIAKKTGLIAPLYSKASRMQKRSGLIVMNIVS